MPKSNSPVRLDDNLMKSAALAGKSLNRSAAEQVEFWASIGRLVAANITPNEVLDLQAGLASITIENAEHVEVDAEALLGEIEVKNHSAELAASISAGNTRYQMSRSHPGFLEQILPNGDAQTGRFINGQFQALK